MKRFLLSLGLLSIFVGASGQQILFSTFTADYVPVTGGTNAVNVAWDDPTLQLPLGFNAPIFGENVSTLYMSDDFFGGVLSFQPTTGVFDAVMAITGDLIDPQFFTSGNLSAPITYQTTGNPGDRIFKLQWENVGFFNEAAEGGSDNLFNMQLWVYENGVVEVRFGPNTVFDTSLYLGAGFTCGLVSGINLSSTSTTVDGVFAIHGLPEDPDYLVSTSLIELNSILLDYFPPDGRVYRFVPNDAINTIEMERDELRLWPLTANEVINLSAGTDGIAFYDVYDLNGKIVAQGNFSGTSTLPVSHLQSGVYLVNLRTENNAHTFKVVKR